MAVAENKPVISIKAGQRSRHLFDHLFQKPFSLATGSDIFTQTDNCSRRSPVFRETEIPAIRHLSFKRGLISCQMRGNPFSHPGIFILRLCITRKLTLTGTKQKQFLIGPALNPVFILQVREILLILPVPENQTVFLVIHTKSHRQLFDGFTQKDLAAFVGRNITTNGQNFGQFARFIKVSDITPALPNRFAVGGSGFLHMAGFR